VHLLRFDPYVPECIQFNTLLAPTASRFLVKGGPRPSASIPTATPLATPSSQASLKIKPTRKQLVAQDSHIIDSTPIQADMPVTLQTTLLDSSPVERVLDSFVAPSSDNLAESIDPVEDFSKLQKAYGDALSQAIEQAKATAHLPIDEDEEESSSSRPSSAAGDVGSDTDEERLVSKARRSKTYPSSATLQAKNSNGGVNQLAFQCMNPNSSNDSTSNNPNLRTIEMLEDMCKYYDQMQDQWRTLAYRRGINTLRKQTVKITTKEEAERLPFIGSRLAEKIEEIALTDRLRRLDSTRDDPTDNVLRLFLGVYGAGLSQASKWIQAGYHTLQDLVEKATLTPNQKIGIQHYDDFATRIPRAEVEAHGAFVRTALCKLDPEFRVYVMGSYRRGALDSGDVDLIITKPQSSIATMRNIVFEQLVPLLFNKGFLKASLATSRRHNEGTKWHGASCLPSSSVWRRLDLLLVPEEEMGAALLYFTGNDIFNRSMRLLASKKGMRLNQRGLYKDVMRGKNREKITQGTLVEGRDEKRIFEILGVPWREPEERIC
jgi:DNA polymerase IV